MDTQRLVAFLSSLQANNNKAWFDEHRKDYESVRGEFIDLVAGVIERFSVVDASVASLNPAKCLFRINRDIRFSPDKSPYKTQFSALLDPGPRREFRAGYYFHICADGDLLVGGGVHGFTPTQLDSVRAYIAANHEALTRILGELSGKGFGEMDGDRLAKVPRPYAADHPAGPYLKYKSFTIGHIENAASVSDDIAAHVVGLLTDAQPFVQFIDAATAGL